jgi:hypothetical protein
MNDLFVRYHQNSAMSAIAPHMCTAATQLTQIPLCEAIYRNANSPKPTAQLQSRAGKNKWNCTIHINQPIHAVYEIVYGDRFVPFRRVGNIERNSGNCLTAGGNFQYSCHEASGKLRRAAVYCDLPASTSVLGFVPRWGSWPYCILLLASQFGKWSLRWDKKRTLSLIVSCTLPPRNIQLISNRYTM